MDNRRHAIAASVTIAAVMGTSSALADTRIFSARTSEPDVTIEQAFRNGEELAIVGRGEDDSTLFRIDSPSTPVGCANRIEFVTSTGEKVEQVADMCVLNWAVTVEVEPAIAEVEVPEVPDDEGEVVEDVAVEDEDVAVEETDDGIPPLPEGATFSQAVTVSTDDPSVTIISVSLDDEPMTITGREGGTVVFEVEGTDEGIVCERAVGLTLSNGSSVTTDANICLNDWNVVVALESETTVADTPDLPAPGTPTAVAGSDEDMAWIFSSFDDGATLIRGIPETDATVFFANCERRSGAVQVTLTDTGVVGLTPGASIPVRFSAGGFSRTYPGTGSVVSEMDGVSLPEVTIPADDPLWQAMIRETSLGVAAGGWATTYSLAGSAGPTRELVAACATAPAGPTPPPATSGPGIVASYRCDNGSLISVRYNGEKGVAVVSEAGAPPLRLQFQPGGSRARYTAGEARLVVRDGGQVRFARFAGPATACRPR
ncbi:hypothetical protein [Bauldia sp.]|uniref:hypothetical protein n=1 Tax=Bauldia sp. TaxID=2575872 RepID=UPI003BAD7533